MVVCTHRSVINMIESRCGILCGECDFPCDLLNQFAYDKEQGDDGKRIEQCRKWTEGVLHG